MGISGSKQKGWSSLYLIMFFELQGIKILRDIDGLVHFLEQLREKSSTMQRLHETFAKQKQHDTLRIIGSKN